MIPGALGQTEFETEAIPETGRRVPGDGRCRRCGEVKPLNRRKLCYRCWVLTEIEDRERLEGRSWIPGMKHPAWCQCVLPEHGGGGPRG